MAEQHIETQNELLTRFELIELMVQEGRKSTEYWGWKFVLWGVAYLVAILWSDWSHRPNIAWPVTMIAAVVISIVVRSANRRAKPWTNTTRSLRAIWIAVGAALFLYCFSAGFTGHFEVHAFMATVEILLGIANFSSAMVLRWHTQFIVAAIWWTSAVATFCVRSAWVIPILVAATLPGMIGFGFYLIYCERRDRQRSEQHA
jgi:hypothetical protein